MIRRGKVLRDTNAGPGLLVVDDTQLLFTLERMWRSNTPPTPGMVVDVEVEGSTVVSVAAVPEGQLAREQAVRALNNARLHGAALANRARATFGVPALVAGGTLVIGWFFLTAGTLATPIGKIDYTFWQMLGALNSGGEAMMGRVTGGGTSTGIYGFFGLVALSGPFIRPLWKSRRAHLAGLLPLVLMLLVAWKIWHFGAPSGDEGAALGGPSAEMARSFAPGMRAELWKSISIGLGAYAAGVAAAYFALVSVRRYLAAAAAAV